MGQGLIKDFGGIVGMRFVLGIFEAGLFPGKSASPSLGRDIDSERVHLLNLDVLRAL
jgi:hypothetical protein